MKDPLHQVAIDLTNKAHDAALEAIWQATGAAMPRQGVAGMYLEIGQRMIAYGLKLALCMSDPSRNFKQPEHDDPKLVAGMRAMGAVFTHYPNDTGHDLALAQAIAAVTGGGIVLLETNEPTKETLQ